MNNNIVILGCPRSGTSITANLIKSAGYDLDQGGTKKLMGPNEKYNPDGYFERWDIVRLNDRLINLISKNKSFLNPPTLSEISNNINVFDEELFSISEYLRNNTGWAIKDSRLSFTFHLYDITDVKFVKVIRNPAEVKQSMIRHYGNMFDGNVKHDIHNVSKIDFDYYYKTINDCIDYQINGGSFICVKYSDIMNGSVNELQDFIGANVNTDLINERYRNYVM